jgi:hypothetical protein
LSRLNDDLLTVGRLDDLMGLSALQHLKMYLPNVQIL